MSKRNQIKNIIMIIAVIILTIIFLIFIYTPIEDPMSPVELQIHDILKVKKLEVFRSHNLKMQLLKWEHSELWQIH